MPVIDLACAHTEGLGLLIRWPSGVIYTHQTGGYQCNHPAEEGVFALFGRQTEEQSAKLTAYFCGPKWRGWCAEGIDRQTADFVDRVLRGSVLTNFLRVDRKRLRDSHEAWVYVDVLELPEGQDFFTIEKFGACKGVLLWENSD